MYILWWITGEASGGQYGTLQWMSQVFSVVDYKETSGAQCGGLEKRLQGYILIDYRVGPRWSV